MTCKDGRTAFCKNLSVMARKTAFSLSLWDNAAIYANVRPGSQKIGRRDDQPILTVRFANQIVVSTTMFSIEKVN